MYYYYLLDKKKKKFCKEIVFKIQCGLMKNQNHTGCTVKFLQKKNYKFNHQRTDFPHVIKINS